MVASASSIKHIIERLDGAENGPWATIALSASTEDSAEQIRISYKNACREARELLRFSPEGPAIVALLRSVPETSRNWPPRSGGSYVFAGPDQLETVVVDEPLTSEVRIGHRPWLDGLRHLIGTNRPIAVLALSRHNVRLLCGDRFGLDTAEVDGLPGSIQDALRTDEHPRRLGSHSEARRGSGAVIARHHGQPDHKAADVDRFLRIVDRAVVAHLDGSTLLLLAGVPLLVDHYRRVSGHPSMAERSITGNHDGTPAAELHQHARSIVWGL